MSMLITNPASVKNMASEKGFALFCAEYKINPRDSKQMAEEEICLDHMDLMRFEADDAARDLRYSTQSLMAKLPS